MDTNLAKSPSQNWNAAGYAANAHFVPALGQPVLDLLEPQAGERILDLGCGDGRDVIEILLRGWKVVAVDAEPEALKRLAERKLPGDERITPIVSRFEDVPMPIGVDRSDIR